LAKLPNGNGGWGDVHDRQTDVDLEILDLLREESPKSAYRLAAALTRAGEGVGTDAVCERLRALASRGLKRCAVILDPRKFLRPRPACRVVPKPPALCLKASGAVVVQYHCTTL
jgi:DNA-binding Lrp family transcriptional regulator